MDMDTQFSYHIYFIKVSISSLFYHYQPHHCCPHNTTRENLSESAAAAGLLRTTRENGLFEYIVQMVFIYSLKSAAFAETF